MFTAENKTQLSVRLKTDENAKVTAFFEHYQQQTGKDFSTFKDLFMHMVENDGFLIEKEEKEAVYVDDIKPELNTYSEIHGLPIEYTAEEIVKNALTQLPPSPEKVEVEKLVEVEKELPENSLLLILDEAQETALSDINKNRNGLLGEADQETIENTAKGMLFNKATLNDYGGEFYTGFG